MKLVESKVKYDGRIIKVFADKISHDGEVIFREVVRHSGGAGVLVERDDKFAFVRQYRHPFGREFLEIPAGTRNGGEPPFNTAVRELEEECGIVSDQLQLISEFAVSPGYTDEMLYVYYCNSFKNGVQKLDDDEDLTVEWIEKSKALKMLVDGEIKDGKTVVALLWYMNNKINK